MSEQQLEAYVAWVNSQLKKQSGTHLIQNLQDDMRDGTALADLVRIIAGDSLTDIKRFSTNESDRLANVDKVLSFMIRHRVRMHHILAEEVVSGNLKSIMRLILALAAHFKPHSVRHSNQVYKSSAMSHPSLMSLAQGAAATIAEARRDASMSLMPRPRRPRPLSDQRFSDNLSDKLECQELHIQQSLDCAAGDSQHDTTCAESAIPKSLCQQSSGPAVISEGDQTALLISMFSSDHYELLSEVVDAKKTLLQLQDLLLNGNSSKDSSCLSITSDTAEEEVVILQNRLQFSEAASNQLRDELSQSKQEILELSGIKIGLQSRLKENDVAYLKLKSELLRMGFQQQAFQAERVDMDKSLADQERLICQMKKEIMLRDQQMEDLVSSLDLQQKERDAITKTLRLQIRELNERILRVSNSEAGITNKLLSQDRNIAQIESRILHSGHRIANLNTSSTFSDDLHFLSDAMHQLQAQLPNTDSCQQQVNVIEERIAHLMSRLRSTPEKHDVNSNAKSTGYESDLPLYNSFSSGESKSDPNPAEEVLTKICYYTEKSSKPYFTTLPLSLGNIRLKDVKSLFDKHHLYRFHFKTLDPEFGTVKEELTNDDDIVPGLEGNIVVWVTEEV